MTAFTKRVIFTMGGKGGVGKTGVIVALAEWFATNEIPATLLDLDTENKARGSLKHFFNSTVTKVNIHTPAGLDAFVDHLEGGASVIVADMGAGAGQVAADWFDSMYDDVAATGVSFTAVGVVTPDPASVESLLAWANRLQDRVDCRNASYGMVWWLQPVPSIGQTENPPPAGSTMMFVGSAGDVFDGIAVAVRATGSTNMTFWRCFEQLRRRRWLAAGN